MELVNEFSVEAPIERVWGFLTNVELIAPCLPGAQLQEIEGEEYRGIVKVKVGPISAQYKGVATFLEKDESNYRIVLRGEGRDTRGAGNASADIEAQLVSNGDQTEVTVSTDLKITGKAAQFGRGVMADISKKLMAQFADNLSELVTGDIETVDTQAQEEETSETETESVRILDSKEVEAVDLLSTAGAPVLKRVLRLAVIAIAIVVVIILVKLSAG
ncbi:MAG TPA: SRPBCC family protein [Acidimicrobiales bacterium]|nr:SRPBCC family protein [Acidimicrobiales bacterium]|tara:strand:+ start:11146 stop:11796 length:651 start_codon:yes stop_codon:yes gene_type:complete